MDVGREVGACRVFLLLRWCIIVHVRRVLVLDDGTRAVVGCYLSGNMWNRPFGCCSAFDSEEQLCGCSGRNPGNVCHFPHTQHTDQHHISALLYHMRPHNHTHQSPVARNNNPHTHPGVVNSRSRVRFPGFLLHLCRSRCTDRSYGTRTRNHDHRTRRRFHSRNSKPLLCISLSGTLTLEVIRRSSGL